MEKEFMMKLIDNGDGTFTPTYVPVEQTKKVEHSSNAYFATIVPCPPMPFLPYIMSVPPLFPTYPPITTSTGLILSDCLQAESEECCDLEDLVVHTPQTEKPKETIAEEVGGDECCELLLNLLISLIKEKNFNYACSREQFAQNGGNFMGFEEGIRLYAWPVEVYAFLEEQLLSREPNVKIPSIIEFEKFLYRENILEAEEGADRRYRKKVKVGNKRVRLWVLREAELFKIKEK